MSEMTNFHHLHAHTSQGSSLKYLEKLKILLIIIVHLRNPSTTAHKNKFMIPIQIPIHNFCNLAVSEMIYKDHHIQITYNLFYQQCCDLLYMICNFCN